MAGSGLDEVQRRLGYRFQQEHLLQEALTHASYLNEAGKPDEADNERLEFLGDAVLNLVVSEHLLRAFPDAPEGILSKLRSRLVSEESLSAVARRLEVGEALRVGRGEEITQGREKPSILGDALEALVAAVYLDGGLDAATACVRSLFQEELASCEQSLKVKADFKTDLQELCQRDFETLPQYRTIRETGPDHDKIFEVEILIRGEPHGMGTGRNKKEAEQNAAKAALKRLGQYKEKPCDIRTAS